MPRSKKIIIIGGALLAAGAICAVLMFTGLLGKGGEREKLEEAHAVLRQVESGLIELSGQLMPSEDVADKALIGNSIETLRGFENSLGALLELLPGIDPLAESGRLEKLQSEIGDVQSRLAESRSLLEAALSQDLMDAAYMTRVRSWIPPLQGEVRGMTTLFYETKRELMGQLGEFVYLANSYAQNRDADVCLKFQSCVRKFGASLDALAEQGPEVLVVKSKYANLRKLGDEYLRPEAYVRRAQPVLESVSAQMLALRAGLDRMTASVK